MDSAPNPGLVAGIRGLAAVLTITLVLAGCGSGRDSTIVGGSDALRHAVERRVEEPIATEAPTTTVDPASSTAWTGRAIEPGLAPLFLTTHDIATVYTRHGPVDFDPSDVSEGDMIVMQTACELLAGAANQTETSLVYDSFDAWFDNQLVLAGAPPEYISAWDPRGMLDRLVEIGCF